MNKSAVNVSAYALWWCQLVSIFSYIYIGMGLQDYKGGTYLALQDTAKHCPQVVAAVLTPPSNV